VKTRKLGSEGPGLSVVGFGAWEAGAGNEWGEAPPKETIVEAIRTVLDTGINWIDTAEVYGNGASEETIALAITGHRDELLIASKVAPRSEGSGFKPEQIRSACLGSLKRLRTGHLDLYQLHWPDDSGDEVPIEDTWGAMVSLVQEGLVRNIGVSNFERDLIERCEKTHHVDSLQQEFSMLSLSDRDLIRWCGEKGIGVVAYGPLSYGLLTGAITAERTFADGDFRGAVGEDAWDGMFRPGRIERSLAIVDGMRPIAERLGVTVAQLALAWNFHQDGVTSAIAGSRNPAHVRSNAEAGDVELNEGALAELEALLPLGPSFA
jgi:aryl-alcohol dehydrogenase-like predicted oxidoreductase